MQRVVGERRRLAAKALNYSNKFYRVNNIYKNRKMRNDFIQIVFKLWQV